MINFIALGVVLLVLLLAFLLFINGVYLVHEKESILLTRFDKFDCVLNSGFHWRVPFLYKPMVFNFVQSTINSSGTLVDVPTSQSHIDMRESILNFKRQEVYTKDTILLDVDSIMYYSIVDVFNAVYAVTDLYSSIVNFAQTQLKEVFGRMTFSECMCSQDQINEYMKQAFSPRFMAWGVKVERMEVLDIKPNHATVNAMKAQMIAERDRRGKFIIAEGQKAAIKIKADGTKIVKQNDGLADQEATRKISEGDARARVELARAESQSLEIIKSALQSHSKNQAQYMLAMRYMELLNCMGTRVKEKTIYLPYEAEALQGRVWTLNEVYGKQKQPSMGTEAPKPEKKREQIQDQRKEIQNDAFSDLN